MPRKRFTRVTLSGLGLLGLGLLACACEAPSPSSRDANSIANASRTEAQPSTASRRHDTGGYKSQSVPLLMPDEVEKTATGPRLYTPAPGTRERSELMDAIRNQTRNDFGTTPVFVVTNLRADGQWAFAQLEPQYSDGRRIQRETTPVYQNHQGTRPLDSLRVDVIWRRENGRWQVYAHNIGSHNAWWLRYCAEGPSQVIPGC